MAAKGIQSDSGIYEACDGGGTQEECFEEEEPSHDAEEHGDVDEATAGCGEEGRVASVEESFDLVQGALKAEYRDVVAGPDDSVACDEHSFVAADEACEGELAGELRSFTAERVMREPWRARVRPPRRRRGRDIWPWRSRSRGGAGRLCLTRGAFYSPPSDI